MHFAFSANWRQPPDCASSARDQMMLFSLLAPRSSRLTRGMTLIELLAVIVILTTIVAAAIPLMSPNNDDRRLREAARALNTFITGAQTRSIALNRPYGVALKRLSETTHPLTSTTTSVLSDDDAVCVEAYYIEQAPAYTGFDANSRACVSIHPTLSGKVLIRFVTKGTTGPNLPTGWAVDLFPATTIRPGDVIQINGTRFQLLNDTSAADLANIDVVNPDSSGLTSLYYFAQRGNSTNPQIAQIVAQPINDSGQQVMPACDNTGTDITNGGNKPPFWCLPAPYGILRQPTPASDEPYQMPEGTAIDLRASGVGSDTALTRYFFVAGTNDNRDPIQIMFTPEGRVGEVTFSQGVLSSPNVAAVQNPLIPFDQAVVDNIFLLVGRRENAPPPNTGTSLSDDQTLQSSTVHAATTDDAKAKLRDRINWLGGYSRWIVIGSQSGRIATIENASFDMAALYDQQTASPYNLSPNTEQLRNAQIQAAREFTAEMGQLGGK
jgi:prepilin-type N-terminal cleavage/methylation domain-containing protein